VRRLWADVLDAVKGRSRTAHALMMSSEIEGLAGQTLTISFRPALLAQRFAGEVSDTVIGALKEVVGVEFKVATMDSSGTAGARPPADPPPRPSAQVGPAPDDSEPDLDDSVDVAEDEVSDADDAALALLKENLGAQVIGEIDQT
jgi:DNA polymerase-3 subunit gamma/tau